MSEGAVRLNLEGAVAHIRFDRPEARNAMTPAMYEQFGAICAELAGHGDVRAVVLRGQGGKSFVSGSDIAQFLDMKTGEDGLAYERKMERYLEGLASLPMPTLAVIEGWAVGGGLNIAACCDLRIATAGSRFGVPIARTLGNCLSMVNYQRLLAGFGEGRAKRMLMLGEMLGTEDALQSGFLSRVAAPDDLDRAVAEIVAQLLGNAPLTLAVSKQALGRLLGQTLPPDDDLIRRCYGSEDFRRGVRAFLDKSQPEWQGH